MSMLIRAFALLAPLFLVSAGSVAAQEPARIAAVVNDQIVTVRDIQARATLIAVSTGQQPSPALFQQLGPVVLNQLVEETLQLQEAKARGVSVGEEEIGRAVQNIERQNNIPPGRLLQDLTRAGLKDTLLQQIRAQIAWTQTIVRRARGTIQVTDADVEDQLRTLRANLGKPEWLVAEIYLPVERAQSEAAVMRTAQDLITQMKRGTRFSELARQFSASPAAARGGDLGWVTPGQLEPEVEAALERTGPGKVSEPPVRSPSGVHILLVREKRIAGGGRVAANAPAPQEIVNFRRLVIPVGKAGRAELESHLEVARMMTDTFRSCDDLDAAARTLPGASAEPQRSLPVRQLDARTRGLLQNLAPGQAAPPQREGERITLTMLCGRETSGGGGGGGGGAVADGRLPSVDEVRERLLAERLETLSRRFMRDLRQAAFIDVRA